MNNPKHYADYYQAQQGKNKQAEFEAYVAHCSQLMFKNEPELSEDEQEELCVCASLHHY